MPSHYGGQGKKKKNGKKLTNAQKLKEHSKHHSKKTHGYDEKRYEKGNEFHSST